MTMAQLSDVLHKVEPTAKHAVDAVAATTAVGTLLGFLPPLAAAFTIIWTGMQMYDWIDKKRIAARLVVKIEDKETEE